MINDRLTIEFQDKNIVLSGPLKYVTALGRSVHNTPPGKKFNLRSVWKVVTFIMFILLPTLRASSITWDITVLRHNMKARSRDTILAPETISGNSVENINNGGLGIENEDTIIYLHGRRDIVKTDASLDYDQMVLDINFYYETGHFHLVDDWLYFTEYGSFNKIRSDGTDQQFIYDLGHISDVHLIDDTFSLLVPLTTTISTA